MNCTRGGGKVWGGVRVGGLFGYCVCHLDKPSSAIKVGLCDVWLLSGPCLCECLEGLHSVHLQVLDSRQGWEGRMATEWGNTPY